MWHPGTASSSFSYGTQWREVCWTPQGSGKRSKRNHAAEKVVWGSSGIKMINCGDTALGRTGLGQWLSWWTFWRQIKDLLALPTIVLYELPVLIQVFFWTCTGMDLGLSAQGNGSETYLEEWERLWGKEICPWGSELLGCPQEREQQLAAPLPLWDPGARQDQSLINCPQQNAPGVAHFPQLFWEVLGYSEISGSAVGDFL